MLIKIATQQYNQRREGRPWIYKVVAWYGDSKPDVVWGTWISDGDGSAGELRIEANPGDLVREGQKDQRRPDKSRDQWYVVGADGQLRPIDSKVAALHYWESQVAALTAAEPATNAHDDLLAACKAARVAVQRLTNDYPDRYYPLLDQLNAAIARAEGGAA